MKKSIEIVKEFYNGQVEYEWNRIVDKPEFLLTCRMLNRYIKPRDKVLDIGGGPGRYTLYLADKGCDVTLFDLSSENVKFAIEQAKNLNLTINGIVGDAREVNKHITEQFDHILLMGPMYHLLDESDRITAMNATLELLKPGGVIFVAFIHMGGGLVFMLRELQEHIIAPDEERFLIPLVNGDSYGGSAFTEAFFINQHLIKPFMEQFPLEKLHLFGQESILAPNVHQFMEQSTEVKEAWLDLAEQMCEKEEYLSWAEHLMYVGRKLNK